MTEKEKTFILLTPGFAKDEADTNCIPLHQALVRSFKQRFPWLRIVVLTFDYPYFKRKYNWFDIEVVSFNGRNNGGLKKLLLWRRVRKELESIRSSSEIVGLLSLWLDTCALVGKSFADKNNLKHYCWLIGQDAKPGNKYVKRIKPAASELIALSDFIRSEFEKNYGITPQHVIPPGIDGSDYAAAETKRDIDIIAVGSLIPLKQYDIFLEVIGELKRQFPEIRACLVGDGPERKRLEDLAENFGLISNVTFTGELQHPLVLQKMQKAKLLLHPSSYEAFGMVCLEALASGTSVISFVKPMNRQVENWYIVKSKEEMIQRAAKILNDTNNGFSKVMPYKIGQTVEKFAELFCLK